MKTYTTSGTGGGQTLSEIETDKIPVYNSREDADADLANLAVGQIIGIKDTGDELAQPLDVVEEGNLHAVTSNAVAESFSYSTTEQKTGGVWIDGKPIYRKVIANLSVGNDTVLVTDVANLIHVGGYFISSANAKIALPYGSPGSITSAYIKDGETQIRITSNQSVTVYIILEYTKTTD